MIGINISRQKGPQENLVYNLVERTAAHVGIKGTIPREAVQCFEEYVGDKPKGYCSILYTLAKLWPGYQGIRYRLSNGSAELGELGSGNA